MSAAVLACKWGLAGAALGAACALLMLSEKRAGRKRLMFRTKVSESESAYIIRVTPGGDCQNYDGGRFSQVKQDKLASYVRHHRSVWPEVEQGLRKHGTQPAQPLLPRTRRAFSKLLRADNRSASAQVRF